MTTTPTTPAKAREIAEILFSPNGEIAYALRSLAQQVEALTIRDLLADHRVATAIKLAHEDADEMTRQIEELTTERDALRAIIVDSVAALGTAASVSQTSSIEFLQDVPGEIRKTVDALKVDAKRYQWWFDVMMSPYGDEMTISAFGHLPDDQPTTRQQFDECIDAAMKAAP